MLSHRLWARRFAADPAIIGRQIRMSGRPYEVIGVMPASFDFTQETEQLWVPIAWTAERKATHDEHTFQIYGRLKDGVTAAQARADLGRLAVDLRTRFPKDDAELDFAVRPMMDDLVGDYGGRLFILLGAVGFVLLIACGNLANLLLARGSARAGEMAIRAALGAGRRAWSVSCSPRASCSRSCQRRPGSRSRHGAFARSLPRHRKACRASSRPARSALSSASRAGGAPERGPVRASHRPCGSRGPTCRRCSRKAAAAPAWAAYAIACARD